MLLLFPIVCYRSLTRGQQDLTDLSTLFSIFPRRVNNRDSQMLIKGWNKSFLFLPFHCSLFPSLKTPPSVLRVPRNLVGCDVEFIVEVKECIVKSLSFLLTEEKFGNVHVAWKGLAPQWSFPELSKIKWLEAAWHSASSNHSIQHLSLFLLLPALWQFSLSFPALPPVLFSCVHFISCWGTVQFHYSHWW